MIETELWAEMTAKNTKKNTKSAVNLLIELLLEVRPRNVTEVLYAAVGQLKDSETLDLDKVDLNDILNAFYANVRKSDGTIYKKNSLVGHRHGLARYFKEKYQTNI